MNHVSVFGGGPAGASAAIAALQRGALVTVYERHEFPRHKVCGEFLSPEIAGLLPQLGLWEDFTALHPFRYTRLHLHFGRREVSHNLSEPAYGLSRFQLDQLLLDRARQLGARIVRDPGPPEDQTRPAVIAHGRREELPRGARLFGFKAHFHGPPSDHLSLYFAGRSYVGVNTIEGGLTNVCGVAPEEDLRAIGFDFDSYVSGSAPLRERLALLTRQMEWLATGPLVFRQRWEPATNGHYRAGDALSFIDPFTGTGVVSAILTGVLAGEHAAAGHSADAYLKACKKTLLEPFRMSSLMRAALMRGWAEKLAPFVPSRWLMRLTRPQL